jgi:hypothetical protein
MKTGEGVEVIEERQIGTASWVLTEAEEMKLLETLAAKHGYGLLRVEPGLTWGEDE